MYKIQKKIDKCLDLVARDEKVVAPCQHLSYYPFAVESGKGEILKDADGNETAMNILISSPAPLP